MSLTLVSVQPLLGLEPAALYEKDAARYCKLSLQSLRELAATGQIQARRHPGRYLLCLRAGGMARKWQG